MFEDDLSKVKNQEAELYGIVDWEEKNIESAKKHMELKINYNNKRFRVLENSENGETTTEMVFEYEQSGNILTSEYSGGEIVTGHLIGLVDENGKIEMSYHQVSTKGELMTGICSSKPELTKNGKIKLYEKWEWTSGDKSTGESVLEEL